tara:strand:+ start:6081 stop:6254 length:174 start_codon:yes stop_codon:yes gene_type:complete
MSDTITAWHERQIDTVKNEREKLKEHIVVDDRRAYQILLEYTTEEIQRALEILQKTK